MAQLINNAVVSGMYETEQKNLPLQYTNEDVEGFSLQKTSDQQYWLTGPLTYSIEIDNDTDIAFEDIKIVDSLPKDYVDFVAGSVERDGTPVTDVLYDPDTGDLKIFDSEPITLAVRSATTVTFQVTKKA